MNREQIIQMAREAGIRDFTCGGSYDSLERFAALVAAASASVEREACIQVVKTTKFSNWFQADVIESIRARGEQA